MCTLGYISDLQSDLVHLYTMAPLLQVKIQLQIPELRCDIPKSAKRNACAHYKTLFVALGFLVVFGALNFVTTCDFNALSS